MGMSAREQITGYVPAAYQVEAIEIMAVAEVYAATNTYPEGFPLPTRQHAAAAELVRLGYLKQTQPGRYLLAPSREIVL